MLLYMKEVSIYLGWGVNNRHEFFEVPLEQGIVKYPVLSLETLEK